MSDWKCPVGWRALQVGEIIEREDVFYRYYLFPHLSQPTDGIDSYDFFTKVPSSIGRGFRSDKPDQHQYIRMCMSKQGNIFD
jgi:hypothetical protein